MKTVKVKDIGVQVNGVSYFKNNVFEVTDEDYEPIKEYVDVLEDDKKVNQENESVVVIKVKNKEWDLKEVEEYLYDCLENFGKEPIGENPNPEENDVEVKELNALKVRAKKLGVRNYHLMGKEKLELVIAEKESENKNPTNNPNKNDTDVDNDEKITGDDNPQE